MEKFSLAPESVTDNKENMIHPEEITRTKDRYESIRTLSRTNALRAVRGEQEKTVQVDGPDVFEIGRRNKKGNIEYHTPSKIKEAEDSPSKIKSGDWLRVQVDNFTVPGTEKPKEEPVFVEVKVEF